MKYNLRSVGVLSVAKLMAFIHGSIALLFIPLCVAMGIATMVAAPGGQKAAGLAFVFFGLFAPLIYAAMGFLMGALGAWLYNLFANRLGGIEMQLYPVAPAPQPVAGTVV